MSIAVDMDCFVCGDRKWESLDHMRNVGYWHDRDLLEYPKDERLVVLNRSDSRVGLTLGDIERVVRSPIVGHVPSTRDVPVSINHGTPQTLLAIRSIPVRPSGNPVGGLRLS